MVTSSSFFAQSLTTLHWISLSVACRSDSFEQWGSVVTQAAGPVTERTSCFSTVAPSEASKQSSAHRKCAGSEIRGGGTCPGSSGDQTPNCRSAPESWRGRLQSHVMTEEPPLGETRRDSPTDSNALKVFLFIV